MTPFIRKLRYKLRDLRGKHSVCISPRNNMDGNDSCLLFILNSVIKYNDYNNNYKICNLK